MALLESVRGKPLPARFLEAIQAGFALLLMGFMLYITTKDLGDIFIGGSEAPELEWPEQAESG
jgi:regulator of sigma E protease